MTDQIIVETQELPQSQLDEWWERGRESLFWWAKAIWGDNDLDYIHLNLCYHLQGLVPGTEEWRRMVVSAFRNSLKSSIVRAWVTWHGLYIPNSSFYWCSGVATKAEEQLSFIRQKFEFPTPVRDLLFSIYRKRIPPALKGWTNTKLILERTDPNARPWLTCGGLDSFIEGAHPDHVVCDDPEGADEDLASAPNVAAKFFFLNRAPTLLRRPAEGKILAVGTPHGKDPTVNFLREMEAEGTLDNTKRRLWKVWWQPYVWGLPGSTPRPPGARDTDSTWPERLPNSEVENLNYQASLTVLSRKMVTTQYKLERWGLEGGFFDAEKLDANLYRLDYGKLCVYPATEYTHSEEGRIQVRREMKSISINHLRRFIHFDPMHVGAESGERKSEWAIIVVGIAPDWHCFVLDTWITREADFSQAVSRFFRLYRRWAPWKVTFESVGAQVWFADQVKAVEATQFRGSFEMTSSDWSGPEGRRLPRPSARLVPSKSPPNIDKESRIFDKLSLWLDLGWLHLHQKHDTLRSHILRVGTESDAPIDGADALAQGPAVWRPAKSAQAEAARKAKNEFLRRTNMVSDITGYFRPYPAG